MCLWEDITQVDIWALTGYQHVYIIKSRGIIYSVQHVGQGCVYVRWCVCGKTSSTPHTYIQPYVYTYTHIEFIVHISPTLANRTRQWYPHCGQITHCFGTRPRDCNLVRFGSVFCFVLSLHFGWDGRADYFCQGTHFTRGALECSLATVLPLLQIQWQDSMQNIALLFYNTQSK